MLTLIWMWFVIVAKILPECKRNISLQPKHVNYSDLLIINRSHRNRVNNPLIFIYIFCILAVQTNGPKSYYQYASGLTNSNRMSIETASTKVAYSGPLSKVCSRCKAELPSTSFAVRYDRQSPRLNAHCRACSALASKRHRAESPTYLDSERKRSATRAAYHANWYENNKEQYLDRQKQKRSLSPPKFVPTSCPVYFLVCEVTGKWFTSKRESRKYSDEGLKLRTKDRAREYDLAKYSPKTFICKHCGKNKQTQYGQKNSVYCSELCAKRQERKLTRNRKSNFRRAKYFGVDYQSFDVTKVFERDKWTCCICGAKTPKHRRGTNYDNAPQIDHVIPMSKGGAHTPNNVQCLCRSCNLNKSDKIVGQLGLFA